MPVQKILITGSSGTIGTRLCEKFLADGFNVVGVDRKPNKWNERVNQTTVLGDLLSKETLEKIPIPDAGFDIVIHLAANARVYNLVVDPSLARDNFETTFNVLEFCRRNNVKRFIFASSREVYGNSQKIIHSEDEAYVRNCESPYTASKIAGEAMVHAYSQCYGVDFIIVRFSNVYGMYDESDRLIPLFIKLTKENKDLIVYGQDKLLDFTYIDDTVDGLSRCVNGFDDVKNNVFNLASGQGSSILEVAKLVQQGLQGKNNIIISENRTGEVVKYIADIAKARRTLDYNPKTDIKEGVKKSIEWYLNNPYA